MAKSVSRKKKVTKQAFVNGEKSRFPSTLTPMLATLVDKPFNADNWLYEIKWDGYRAMAFINKGKVELKSRNNKSFNEKFYPVFETLKSISLNAVLDGEIIVAADNGLANFGALQNWRSEADGKLMYYVFDILWLNGHSLTHLSLLERRHILTTYLKENDILRISQAFDTDGTTFFKTAQKMKLEGIMAKKKESIYEPGMRSKDWLKIKNAHRHEVVIGGYTHNEGSAKKFSSLLVGVFEKNELRYTGKIGTGFTDKLQTAMMKQFKPLLRKTSPFKEIPNVNKATRFRPNPPNAKAIWLKPQLVCEVSYTEVTTDGVMRHPSFEGMRTDKKASDVQPEKALHLKKKEN